MAPLAISTAAVCICLALVAWLFRLVFRSSIRAAQAWGPARRPHPLDVLLSILADELTEWKGGRLLAFAVGTLCITLAGAGLAAALLRHLR
ncbi:hypothetical protein OOT46_04670 [Aquabacterium sp. A7-Y]|uniref:hypothetical protein n=1 Tax=Aquabacterium sp. A7-Y TaxID=1349605 RepID=UPI00223CD52F|nr:hypothetical protein [Aquabacterium sp. A7-Y]MCW7537144.1 hypothetical protein [Aquabacterium sp. A7-Y]